ncbi:fatty acyl-CoA reductase wat-like [Hylaeus anthracinus]|uniref:fatty acyl-CoA reductase wat-like n=1 Tax=Hylaeus anthracinus TaxID=313031 RepID=UPI0023B91B48|nr:fatty acyl-CoA reductase wat-like [Hylaeus anthracinus]
MSSEGSDAYLNDMLDMSDNETVKLKNEKSEIAEFFAGTNVLVTGGTGFLGKLLVEKLLRSCPDIAVLYTIVRPKKGKSSEERFKENFAENVYDKLKSEQPNFLDKVVMLEGDAAQEDFGLSKESKEILMNTNIIFHAAATVRFDEKFRMAMNINVKSTKYMLQFAKQLSNLKAFVHISTAFSHCISKSIDEVYYDVPIDGDKLLKLLDILNDDILQQITPILLDKWPNTYVFSKAIGENMVLKYSNDLPVCIVRPSIVISTDKEPLHGWTNNLYGATGVVMAAGVGLMRTLHCKPEKIADVIPADYVVANIISSAWDVANRRSLAKSNQDSTMPDEERTPIYNSVSSCQKPLSWGDFMYLNEACCKEQSTTKAIWHYMLVLNRCVYAHHIYSFVLHIIPAVIVDTFARATGRKPMCMDTYRKIHKFSKVISYFSSQEWYFRNDNVMKLWQKLNSVDRKIFNFNVTNLDWEEYCYRHIRGIRIYMFKESPDSLQEGVYKFRRLRIAHYTLLTIISLLVLWLVVWIVSFL